MQMALPLSFLRTSNRFFCKKVETFLPFHSKSARLSVHHKPTMADGTGLQLTDVVSRLESYASSSHAESWDNVGLLVEPSTPHVVSTLFLTNDLTEEVMEEAKQNSADLIVSYHPPLFSSIKRITQSTWKNRILVKAMENRIAIYSPHTSYDAIKGGVNDWLLSCFDGEVTPITPSSENPENGMGRILKLHTPLLIEDVLTKVKKHLGLSHVRVAFPTPRPEMIYSIGSCAGSGASVLRNVRTDLYLTGEMSHHDVLDAVANKRVVILCEHSNTERGFLHTLKPLLENMMENKVKVLVSGIDKDPLMFI